MTVIQLFTVCPRIQLPTHRSFRRMFLSSPFLCGGHIQKSTHKIRNLYLIFYIIALTPAFVNAKNPDFLRNSCVRTARLNDTGKSTGKMQMCPYMGNVHGHISQISWSLSVRLRPPERVSPESNRLLSVSHPSRGGTPAIPSVPPP